MQKINMLQINDQPTKLKPSSYIGKHCATTNGKNTPDLTLQLAFLNDFFYKKSGVHFVRMSIATDRPEEFYKNMTKTLRGLNHGRWRKEPVSGFRLCNVQRMTKAWRFTVNVACVGSFYASVIFDSLRKLHRAYGRTVYVVFNEPRRTLVDRAYRQWYEEFYERSHLLRSQVKIDMLERYYWRFDVDGVAISSLVNLLFDLSSKSFLPETRRANARTGIEYSDWPAAINNDDAAGSGRSVNLFLENWKKRHSARTAMRKNQRAGGKYASKELSS